MKQNEEQFIERRIATGLIISTQYITKIHKIWNSTFILSKELRTICNWCLEFYNEFGTAPGRQIEDIYLANVKKIQDTQSELIENLLADLSDEYTREEKFNVNYLVDQTITYFDSQQLTQLVEEIEDSLDKGEVKEAKNIASRFSPQTSISATDLDLSSEDVYSKIEDAFRNAASPLVLYPNQLGKFLNAQLVRGGFVALLAPEKRGKTWFMLDLAMRASEQGTNVAFFQAGDMTEGEQLKRVSINLARKSDQERYSGKMYEPRRDCIYNQDDSCTKAERESSIGLFPGVEEDVIRKQITKDEVIAAQEENPDYVPCFNCKKYWTSKWGVPAYEEVDVGGQLTEAEAKKAVEKFFVKKKRGFMLSTHPSKTLTVSNINSILDSWEKEKGFVPDLIVVDYVDILAAESNKDFRHQENEKWTGLRSMSEARHSLVVTATQADANAYKADTLNLSNFSEDKRKFAHVTAMYGLNQDVKGREKKMGIMRINQLVVREEAFDSANHVTVLQNLSRGLPVLQSYF
jgi:replicative DNA helicase